MRILYWGLSSGTFGGVRIINNHCNLLSDRGHHVGYSALDGSSITWLPQRYEVLQPTEVNPRDWDVMVATEINTWPVLKHMVTPAKKFTFVQMLEWQFFAKSNPRAAKNAEQCYWWHDLEPICIARHLVAQMKKRGHKKVHLVPWGLDFDLFYPDEPLIPKGDKIRILIEGHSMNEAKDTDNLAWKAIESIGRDNVEVWGLSQGPPRYQFDQYYMLPPQDMLRRIYSSCDILVKASRYEGRPAPPFEAMACGCAVAIALNQGTDDLIYGKNCLLSQYNELKLNRNLKKLVEDNSLRRELIDNGLKYVQEHFAWGPLVDRLIAAFEGEDGYKA